MDKTKFISDFKSKLGIEPKNATPQQIHNALGEVVMEMLADNWNDSREKQLSTRRACYFSMECLVGRAVYNNILCLGIYDEVESALNE